MIAKTFEVRDSGTFIPVLAVQLSPGNEADRYLLGRAGYGTQPTDQSEYILLCRIDGGSGHCTSDCFSWGGAGRTMTVAHEYISENFEQLKSGDVVDVQFIIGETSEPKMSEARVAY